jgi:hypothetical protein
MKRPWLASFALSVILVLAGYPTYAQQNVGSVAGTVRDTSGAVIPQASVIARHVATGGETTVVTNNEGAYSFPALAIGEYIITASRTGFHTVQRTNVRVISAVGVPLDFDLSLGAVTQAITVTASAVALDTTTTSAGTTRVTEEIAALPLAQQGSARNAQQFMRTLGPVNIDNESEDIVQTERADYYGGRVYFTGYLIDGVSASLNLQQGLRDDGGPIPDMVEEFRISTNPAAEYGEDLGVSFNFVTKSGSNNFHGTAFEYLRNSTLDARNFFAANVTPHKQNEFGAFVGGPIKKDKLFFWGSFDGYYLRKEPSGVRASLPSVKMRAGDLSEWLGPQTGTDILGRPVYTNEIYDPATTRADGAGGFLRDPFAFNGQLNVIDPARLSTLSKVLQAGLPLPTSPGIGQNWVGGQSPSPVTMDKVAAKVDSQWGQNRLIVGYQGLPKKDQIYGTIAFDPRISQDLIVLTHEYHFQVNYSRTLRPNLFFQFRTGFSRAPREIGTASLATDKYGTTVGWKGVYTSETPSISIAGSQPFGAPFRRISDPSDNVPVDADFSWSKGQHSAKFGTQYIFLNIIKRLEIGSAGNINFQPTETGLPASPATGVGYASYLLGQVDRATLSSPQSIKNSSRVWAFYAQDSWRATRKLTLNYGLRWGFSVGPWETFNRFGGMDPTLANAAAGGRLGALTFWGDGAGRNGRHHLYDGYYGAFGPRLGIAYAWNPKTVIRAYYGLITAPAAAADMGSGIGLTDVPPITGWGASTIRLTTDGGVTPAFQWDNGFPGPLPNLPNLDPTFRNGQSASYIDPASGRLPSYSHHLGFTVERELPGGIFGSVAYIGNLIHRWPAGAPINNLDPKYLSLGFTLLQDINSPEAKAAGIQPPWAGFAGSVQTALLPYPQYPGGVNQFNQKTWNTFYHAMEVKAQKRFGSGLSFLADYTISKMLDSANDVSAALPRIKNLDSLDSPWKGAFSYNYELPFGPGKPFLQTSNPFLNHLVGGWAVAGIHQYNAGTAINLARVNLTGAPIISTPCGQIDPGNPTKNRYLNPAAFSLPAPFTFGSTAQLSRYRTCSYFSENVSITKDFRIGEKFHVNFAGQFFNILNRHQFKQMATNVAAPATFGTFGAACTGGAICTAASDPRFIQLSAKISF